MTGVSSEDDTLFEVPEEWWHRRQCPVCGCALSLDFTHTYVVQRQWWVKIGATNRPRQRLNELARVDWRKYILSPDGMDWTEPLITLVVIGANVEHDLHQQFRDKHAVGEWFNADDQIREWVRATAEGALTL